MNFTEAIKKLKMGSKISRNSWSDRLYIVYTGGRIYSYLPMFQKFAYTEDIMISEGWIISENGIYKTDKEYDFCEIIPLLEKGCHAKLKEWSDSYIYIDGSALGLIKSSLETFPFIPCIEDFTAKDWIEIC